MKQRQTNKPIIVIDKLPLVQNGDRTHDQDALKKQKRPNRCLHFKNFLNLHHFSYSNTNSNSNSNSNSHSKIRVSPRLLMAYTIVAILIVSIQMIDYLQESMMDQQQRDMNMEITARLVKERQSHFPRTVYIQHLFHTHDQSHRHEEAIHDYHRHHHGSPSLRLYNNRRLDNDEIEHNLHQNPKNRIDYIPPQPKEHHHSYNHNHNHHHHEPDEHFKNISTRHYSDSPECKPMHSWSSATFATCNTIHEQPLNNNERILENNNKLLAMGYYRSTFRVLDGYTTSPIAMKTMNEVDDEKGRDDGLMLERHRIDSLFYERMTKSPWILDIYGFCGNSGLFEFAGGGGIHELFNHGEAPLGVDKREKLKIAVEVASGLSDLHSIESRNGHSAFVHSDLKADQFILAEDGKFKLNDFNKGRLMYWNTTSNTETCPFHYKIGKQPNKFNAPEEYSNLDRTEMVDTFSMGNVLYQLLTNKTPFSDVDKEDAIDLLKEGRKPRLSKELLNSDHPVDIAIIEALRMSFVHDWEDRYNSTEIRDYLSGEFEKLQ